MKDLKSLKKWMMFNGFANSILRDSMHKTFEHYKSDTFRTDAEFSLVHLLAPFGLSMKTEPEHSPFDATIYNLEDDFAMFLKWSENGVTTGVYTLSEEVKNKRHPEMNFDANIEQIFKTFLDHVNGSRSDEEYIVFNGDDYKTIFQAESHNEFLEDYDENEDMSDGEIHEFIEDFFYFIGEEDEGEFVDHDEFEEFAEHEDFDEFSEFEDFSEGDFDDFDEYDY